LGSTRIDLAPMYLHLQWRIRVT